MRILTSQGEFDLPESFTFEKTKGNPMLSDIGEQTSPAKIPATSKNLMLIGWSNRIDSYYKPLNSLNVTVIEKLDSKPGRLYIHSADDDEGISCTVYFNTSEFYSLIDEIELQSLPWGEEKSPNYDSQTPDERRMYLINLLKSEYDFRKSNVFKVVPLRTNTKLTWKVNKYDVQKGKNTITNVESNFILNGFDNYSSIDFYGDNEVRLNTFFGETERILIDDSTEISVKAGYGMTPFLLLNYVLKFIFSNYGYEYSPSYEVMRYTFIINNVADAIYDGILRYWQLLPNVKVKDFLSEVEKWYAGKFVIDEYNKKAVFIRYENRFTSNPDFDLTPYIKEKPKLGSAQFKKLIIDDNNDEIQPVQQKNIPNEIMSFNFPGKVMFNEAFNVIEHRSGFLQGDNVTLQDIEMMQIGDITHKNSKIIVNNQSKSEKENKNTDILFGDYTFTLLLAQRRGGVTGNIFYYSSGPFDDMYGSFTNVNKVDRWYKSYADFLLNSNIPISAKLNIPQKELSKLDITVPKLILGQKVLIETIKTTLDDNNVEQDVSLRTLRPFVDRT